MRRPYDKYYDQKVQPRNLDVDDLVLKKIQTRTNWNMLSPMWEGSYTVVEVT